MTLGHRHEVMVEGTDPMAEALRAVPRHLFVPDVAWAVFDRPAGTGTLRPHRPVTLAAVDAAARHPPR
ncbi:hypothetical protein [Actinomadura sp. SCN-SB]|uniref:hypothetical protein n=1 Tax=Actinomadura sp. SCN-SB TaxID=3373092 RepID=UPI0037531B8A